MAEEVEEVVVAGGEEQVTREAVPEVFRGEAGAALLEIAEAKVAVVFWGEEGWGCPCRLEDRRFVRQVDVVPEEVRNRANHVC